jgi:signal transduction histidine kinase
MVVGGAAGGQMLRRHLQIARLKTDLVAAVSHELRTPLASMRVLVDGLLADREIDPVKTREYLELMATENARLSRLIGNFLTFARLDRPQPQFAMALLDPSAILADVREAMRDRIPSGCDLRVEIAPALPPVMADREALATALINLIDNAIKYTGADKRIVIRAGRTGDGRVAFSVADNGTGIARREQRRVFRRFYRVDRRLSRDTAGVGLGLSIVEMIVRGHGGTVAIDSAVGQGSTFTILMPAAAEGAAA